MVSEDPSVPHTDDDMKDAPDAIGPAQRAYDTIRQAILSGQLKGGEHLREEPLARLTGTSRTPVREALRRLVAEGLAVAESRHRFVADFSFDEVVLMFDLRARMEGYAARVAAQRITAAEIERLAQLVEEMDEVGEAHDAETTARYVTLNAQFHEAIVRAARSRHLEAMILPVIAVPLVTIKKFVWEQPVNVPQSNAQHRDIVAALRDGKPDWAEHAMTGHILSIRPRGTRRS